MKKYQNKYTKPKRPVIFRRQLTLLGRLEIMLRAKILSVIYAIVALKTVYGASEGLKDGKLLSRPATFHFPEYAYKETSKNVSITVEILVIDFSNSINFCLFTGNNIP